MIRAAHHILGIRIVLSIFNLEDREPMDNFSTAVSTNSTLMIAIHIAFLIPLCSVERYFVHVPITLTYQLAINFGMLSTLHNKANQEMS